MEIKIRAFLILALDGGKWLAPRSGCFSPEEKPRYQLNSRLSGPPAGMDVVVKREILPCREPNPGHPARSRFLYWLRFPVLVTEISSAELRGSGSRQSGIWARRPEYEPDVTSWSHGLGRKRWIGADIYPQPHQPPFSMVELPKRGLRWIQDGFRQERPQRY